MIKRYQRHLIGMCIVALMLLAICADAADKYPKPTAWVNDYAGVLSSDEKLSMNAMLQDFEATDSTQVFVAIMKHLPSGMTIEEFANDLFAEWQIGQKKKDNGVLLLIAIQDRQLRIEVGYGLEAHLTDAKSKLIITNEIAPTFKQNRYGEGVTKGVNAIIAACRGAYSPEKKSHSKQRANETKGIIAFFRGLYEKREALTEKFLLIFFIAILIILEIYSRTSNVFKSSTRSYHSYNRPRYRRSGTSSSSSSGRSSGGFSGGGGGRSGGGGASGSW